MWLSFLFWHSVTLWSPSGERWNVKQSRSSALLQPAAVPHQPFTRRARLWQRSSVQILTVKTHSYPPQKPCVRSHQRGPGHFGLWKFSSFTSTCVRTQRASWSSFECGWKASRWHQRTFGSHCTILSLSPELLFCCLELLQDDCLPL